ncbi:MAG: hypothetical protein QM731_05775 [Chitinophagaceae bacterium]
MFANMAKQGYFKFERTFGCVTFYRVGDKWYFRQKSSLSSQRVKTSKRFANTMANARSLGRGARLASVVYRKLPESWKMFELYQKLTGIAAQLLREGKCDDDIVQALELQLYDWGYRKEVNYPVIQHVKKKKIRLRTPRQCKKMEENENRSLMPEVGERHRVQGTRKIRNKKCGGKISKERQEESWQLTVCSYPEYKRRALSHEPRANTGRPVVLIKFQTSNLKSNIQKPASGNPLTSHD